MKRLYSCLMALSILGTGIVACNDNNEVVVIDPPVLNANLEWYANNRNALDQMIHDRGIASANYDAEHPPIAVFDWDNTSIKNDIGDQTMHWMINHNLILQPPNKDWSQVSPYFTEEAIKSLAACDSQANPGQAIKSDTSTVASRACADELFNIYYNGETKGGDPAYSVESNEFLEPAYAFGVQAQAGYTPAQLEQIANDVIDFTLGNAIGAKQQIGNTVDAEKSWIRQYEQIKDLMNVLKSNGFEVWVVSASSDPIVKAFAGRYGVPADHVIGVRSTLDNNGKTTYRFQGCGDFTEGNADIITYKSGKRCWVNKEIFGVTDPKAQLDPTVGVTFAAGDSDTDIRFLQDAEYQLVINRNKSEIMCNAYYNEAGQGNWIVNPMFIKPLAQFKDGYACGAYGLPDQIDTVFVE